MRTTVWITNTEDRVSLNLFTNQKEEGILFLGSPLLRFSYVSLCINCGVSVSVLLDPGGLYCNRVVSLVSFSFHFLSIFTVPGTLAQAGC